MKALRNFVGYIQIFVQFAGMRLVPLFVGIIAGSLMDLVGIAMLLPIISASTGSTTDNPVTLLLAKAFVWFGIEQQPSIGILLMILVAVFLLKGVIVLTYKCFAVWIDITIRLKIRKKLTKLFQQVSYRFYTSMSSGYVNNTLFREVERFSACFAEFTRMPVTLAYIVAYTAMAAVIRLDLTVGILGTGLLVFLLFKTLMSRTRRLSIEMTSEYGKVQSSLIEIFRNFVYLRATNRLAALCGRLDRGFEALAKLNLHIGYIGIILKSITEPLAVCILALLIYVEVGLRANPIAEVFIIALLLYRLIGQILLLQGHWQRFNQSVGGLLGIQTALHDLAANPESDGNLTVSQSETIQFHDVGYSYGSLPTLAEINIDIPANRTIGIVGPSGAGKTTFFYLLTGLLEPTTGHITIDGQDLRDIDKAAFRDRVGFVTQDPAIFNDTIANNISLWDGDSLDSNCRSRIVNAARVAGFGDLLERLDSTVGEGGVTLSGGQRQRVAIARELYKEPDILIFDEATSALDSQLESEIQANIEAMHGSRTVIIITHRLSMVQNCDFIYVFHEGRVVESGNFGELYSRQDSRFYDMCLKQGIRS